MEFLPANFQLNRYDRIAIKMTIIVIAFILLTVGILAAIPFSISKWIFIIVAGIQIGNWIFKLAKWLMEKDYD